MTRLREVPSPPAPDPQHLFLETPPPSSLALTWHSELLHLVDTHSFFRTRLDCCPGEDFLDSLAPCLSSAVPPAARQNPCVHSVLGSSRQGSICCLIEPPGPSTGSGT